MTTSTKRPDGELKSTDNWEETRSFLEFVARKARNYPCDDVKSIVSDIMGENRNVRVTRTPTNESPAPQADEDETGAWADLRASGGIFPEAYAVAQSESVMTEDQIKHMVDRFLSWKLPKTFNPDNGISYKRPNYHPNVDATPSGTNLLDATQADAMVRHMLDGMPQ